MEGTDYDFTDENLVIGRGIEKVGDELTSHGYSNAPSTVVVNLAGRVPKFSYVKGHPQELGKQSSEYGQNYDNLDYLNIRGDHWEEICGGGANNSNSNGEGKEDSESSCDLDTITRNVVDYLELQKSLYSHRMARINHQMNIMNKELTQKRRERDRSRLTLKRHRKTGNKGPTISEQKLDSISSSFSGPFSRIEDKLVFDLLLHKKHLRNRGFVSKFKESLNICFDLQNTAAKCNRALRNPRFLFKVSLLFLTYFLLACLAFVLITPMFYTEEEFRNDFGQRVPDVCLDLMSWISSSVSFFPLTSPAPPPPPKIQPELSTFWILYKTLQFISFT